MPSLKSKFIGSLIGVAVGDALGMVVEGWSAGDIRATYGVLKEMQDQRFGPGRYTDDTQMTLLIAESLLDQKGFDSEDLAKKFARWPLFARGGGYACTVACNKLAQGVSWKESGVDSAGCGSAMRVAPIGLFFHGRPDELLEAVRISSLMTHTDPRAVAGALAVAHAVSLCISWEGAFDPRVFLSSIASFIAPTSHDLSEKVNGLLLLQDKPLEEAMEHIGVGGFVMETVPAALFYFILSPDDFETGMINAVNGGGDTDSIAAILGGISGAYNGIEAIPDRWVKPLESRKRIVKLGEELSGLV